MSRPSHRQKILTTGLQVVHQHGFAGASVRDIVQAAGVPQGSFTNHFPTTEAFALEVIDLYLANVRRVMAETLLNDALPPLQRLGTYIETSKNRLNKQNMRNGCLFGNFTAEVSDQSEAIRLRLVEVFAELQAAFTYCLKAAIKAGELPPKFKCEEVAGFIVSSLQGANLLAKAQHSPVPVERFRRILFGMVLRKD